MNESIAKELVLSLSILLVSFPAPSLAQYSSLSKESPKPRNESQATSPTKHIEIDSSGTGVRIDVENRLLADVLSEISRQTGIHFKVAPSLANQTLTASIQAPDWETGIETLLEEISTLTLWGNNSRMSEVVLLGNREVFSTKTGNSLKSTNNGQKPTEILLSRKQLQKLAKGPFRNPLPPEFLKTPPFKNFLLDHGVETQEDLQQVNKAIRVRKAARIQLKSLKAKGAN